MLSPIGFAFVVLFSVGISAQTSEKIGWEEFIKGSTEEWHDIPLKWEKNATVPDWVKGQFIRNGPGRLEFGGEKHYTMYMDGWGKLHSFKLHGGKVLASGKLTETALYKKNVDAKEILPAVTLAPVGPTDWSSWEMIKGIKNGFDNTNTHVWRYGSSKRKEDAQYVSITDYPTQTEFDVDSLDFKRAVVPAGSWGSCAHPLREPGTDNSINYQVKTNWMYMPTYFEVWRYTTLDEGSIIARWKPKNMGYIHSFSVTQNYAIFFFYPLTMNYMKMMKGGHPLTGLEWDDTKPTDIYVVNLKTGVIDLETSTMPIFSAHHVNAYEDDENGRQLVVDLCQTDPSGMGSYMKLDKMREAEQGIHKATSVLRRFTLNMDTKMTAMTTPQAPVNSSSPIPKWITTFDFPTINEKFRGKRYCYAYGVVAIDYAFNALVKKSLCGDAAEKDAVWRIDNNYYSEANFVANPEAKSEDDGVLVTIGHDGVSGRSYLLVIDAITFKPINHAYSPHRIPYSFHGNFFGEA